MLILLGGRGRYSPISMLHWRQVIIDLSEHILLLFGFNMSNGGNIVGRIGIVIGMKSREIGDGLALLWRETENQEDTWTR